jgi:hypothetical protein
MINMIKKLPLWSRVLLVLVLFGVWFYFGTEGVILLVRILGLI